MRWRILSVVGILYAVQFIPAIFIFMTLPIIMREAGHSATDIGLVQLVGIPYVFKFLWAPLVDRYSPGASRYKSWIVLLSCIHVLALIVVALLDPSGPILPLFILLLVAITAVSTQDVAVDALAISLMRPDERAVGASFQAFGIYLGAVVGAFGFLKLYGIIGWTPTLLVQAAVFALPLFALMLVEEADRQHDAPPVGIRSVMQFFTQPRMARWLALLATIRLPLVFVSLPIRLMMVDAGMTTDEIALWFGLIAMSVAGGATLSFGPLLRRLPRLLALFLVAVVNLVVLVAICLLAATLPDAIRFAIIVTWFAIAVTDTLLLRGAMDKVRPRTPGFDFSVQVALFTLLAMLANPVAGVVIDVHGYLPVFGGAVFLAAIPLVILRIGFGQLRNARGNPRGGSVVSTGTITTTRAAQMLDSCAAHFTEHGIDCTQPKPGVLLMKAMGCQVEMESGEGCVQVRIETPTDNFMIFIRDELVEHIAQIDPKAAQNLSWVGGIQVGRRPANFIVLRATRRRQIFDGLVRVTLFGSGVRSLTSDGMHIKIMMPEQRSRVPVWPVIKENGGISWPEGEDRLHTRFVTIRSMRLAEQEIDVDIALHDEGLISDWAALADDQQEVGVMGPGGDLALPATDHVILAADLTGLPALARFVEGVRGQVGGYLFAAAPSKQVLEEYLPSSNLSVTAIDPEKFSTDVVELIAACTDEPVSYGWFAGEFSTARVVRGVYRQKYGLSGKRQHAMAYWRIGEPGHHP